MEYQISEARQNIQAWKAHILRSINQDAARHEILENLDAKSISLTMDWAMKLLPRNFRESQSDWFGKRGIPWHVSVAMRNNANNETEMLTFGHTFESFKLVHYVMQSDISRYLRKFVFFFLFFNAERSERRDGRRAS